ncbi:MAG: hypothetical protein AAB892_01025 [Patescibacteria group bacterium]
MNPTAAALINWVVPGASYIFLKERVAFGWLLIAALVISIIAEVLLQYADPIVYGFNTLALLYSTTPAGISLEVLTFTVWGIPFGYDAYVIARRKSMPPHELPLS